MIDMDKNRIEEIIGAMSLEEKVAQLSGLWIKDLMENDQISLEKCRERIPNGIGHICQFGSTTPYEAEKLAELIAQLQEYVRTETKSKIPILFHEEAITGVAVKGAVVFPQMIGMSCSWNPRLVYENARITGKNMKRLGAYHALSPMMDVITDARWGRGEEGFGEDSYLVTAFATAFIRGLQEEGVAATAKHFAGYGVDNQELTFFRNETLLPFEAAVKEAGVKAIMPGYHAFHDIPCAASDFLLQNILRDEWGFDGLIVSDYDAIKNVESVFRYASSNQDAAVKCIQAGIDVELPKGICYEELIKAVEDGKLSEKTIDNAVYRVLRLKQELGLFEEHAKKEENFDLDLPEYREQSARCARETIVLLKNAGIRRVGQRRLIAYAIGFLHPPSEPDLHVSMYPAPH